MQSAQYTDTEVNTNYFTVGRSLCSPCLFDIYFQCFNVTIMKHHASSKGGSACYGRMRSVNCSGEPLGLPTVLSMESSDSMMVSSDTCGDLSPNCTEKALLKSSSKEVSDCLSEWITYLQMLNGLCGAGSRLAQTLSVLQMASSDASSGCAMRATQSQNLWEDLARVVSSATSVVRAQTVRALQDIEQHSDPTQACRSLTTLMGLQYQFCVACCECLGALAPCHCCSAAESVSPRAHDSDCMVTVLQHNFARLYLPPPPAVRSPMPFPLPTQQSPQRRWSEAAAREMAACGESAEDGMMRRWSMPWDVRGANSVEQQAPWSGRLARDKLCVPGAGAVLDRSRSTTPESTWHSSLASQEELADVISLLSCRPNTASYPVPLQLCHPSDQHPGVTVCAADDCQMKASTSPVTHSMQGWRDPSAESTAETQASQKSSSSTDSSSLSLHSRSSGGDVPMDGRPHPGAQPLPHLYSMWSGADVPFIKLPDSGDVNSERYPQ